MSDYLTVHQAAAALDGCQYRDELADGFQDELARSGLIAVFGGSDDLMYLVGAKVGYEECGSNTLYLTPEGPLESECDEGPDCPYYKKLLSSAATLTPVWDRDGVSWRYDTSIPHATFRVMEDDEVYCVGIVFRLADAHP